MPHKPCRLCLPALEQGDKAVGFVFTLQVDDTLITGQDSDIDEFAKRLAQKFGKIFYQKDSFSHFIVDTTKCPRTHNVTLCQRTYLAQIKQIEVDAERGRVGHLRQQQMLKRFQNFGLSPQLLQGVRRHTHLLELQKIYT